MQLAGMQHENLASIFFLLTPLAFFFWPMHAFELFRKFGYSETVYLAVLQFIKVGQFENPPFTRRGWTLIIIRTLFELNWGLVSY